MLKYYKWSVIRSYYLIDISKAHTKENIGLNCWCQCLWDFGQNLILGDFWQISMIINWNFGEIKEDDEEEGITHDWIRVTKPDQANAELFGHTLKCK